MTRSAAGEAYAASRWFVSTAYRCVGNRLSATGRQDRTPSCWTSSTQTRRRPGRQLCGRG